MLRTSSCSELDICRIHLEEYHELVVYTFNRFIRYTVIFSVHMHLKQWRLRGRESKKAGYIFCSILIVSSSNTALPLIYLKMSSWELTKGRTIRKRMEGGGGGGSSKKKTYKEFDREKKFQRFKIPPPPPQKKTFLMVRP